MAYNAAAGVERRHNLRFRFGGSLTWAAKPRVRGSPDPALDVESIPARSPLLAFCSPHGVRGFRSRGSACLQIYFIAQLDDIVASTVAGEHLNSYQDRGTQQSCFVQAKDVSSSSMLVRHSSMYPFAPNLITEVTCSLRAGVSFYKGWASCPARSCLHREWLPSSNPSGRRRCSSRPCVAKSLRPHGWGGAEESSGHC